MSGCKIFILNEQSSQIYDYHVYQIYDHAVPQIYEHPALNKYLQQTQLTLYVMWVSFIAKCNEWLLRIY